MVELFSIQTAIQLRAKAIRQSYRQLKIHCNKSMLENQAARASGRRENGKLKIDPYMSLIYDRTFPTRFPGNS